MTLGQGAILGLIAVTALASAVVADDFADHLVPPYEGSLIMPDFSGAQADFRNFRTRIAEGIHDQGITFAGHWTLIHIGCGTNCTFGYAVDLSDGSITPLPIGGENYQNKQIFHELYSNLLKATWTEGWPPDGRCLIGEWLLEDDTFRELRVFEHPVYDDCLR